MTPQLQQAIKLLQMSRMELVEMVQQEMLENPVLEDGQDGRDSVLPQAPDAQTSGEEQRAESPVEEHKKEDIDWERYLENHSMQGQAPQNRLTTKYDDLPTVDQTLSRPDDLIDHLSWQLTMGDFQEDEVRFGALVLGNLGDDGFLRMDGVAPEDIVPRLAKEADLNAEDAEEVLIVMQHFDPLATCARTLSECLMIQAEQVGADELLLRVIRDHIPNLQKRAYPVIAKDLDVPVTEIYDIAQAIAQLEPRPARHFVTEEPRYITPDVHVHKVGDDYFVVSNDDGMPKLKISGFYRGAMADNPKAKEYIEDKLKSAQWLIRSIDQRRQTIIKVAECILDKQRDFFEKGIEHLKPMILKDVADAIEMHESTVSRVTSNKYIATPRGVFELKYFFNSAIKRDSEDDIASESVKQAIKKIVSAENTAKPYSDQKLVTLLKDEHGIRIARRTVAKYREMLGILSSTQRKKYF